MAFAKAEHGLSERQACKLLELDRSSYRYEPELDRNEKLRDALIDLARQKPRYGYRRLAVLLREQGWLAIPVQAEQDSGVKANRIPVGSRTSIPG